METQQGLLERIAAERAYLHALATKWLGNPERSEDAVQSALLAGIAAAASYRGSASLRTWLGAILKNRIADERRARAREPLAADLDGPLQSAEVAADPSEEAEARQIAERLQSRLDSLPAACSRAFQLRELQGTPSTEIRRRLGLTPSQFWQCLHKVRRELRAELVAC